jgi:hypothetical protein
MLQLEPTTTVAEVEEAITHALADQRRQGNPSRRYNELEAELERLWDMRALVILRDSTVEAE